VEILLYTFYLLILFSFIFLVGFSFLRIINYQSIFFLEFITGISIILILSNFFYFFLNISLSEILLLFFIYSIFSFLYLILYFKKNILIFFFRLEILLIFIPVFCGILIALYYGEQFYVFRGNHYDHTWYVANSVLIKKFRFLEYYNFFKSNDLFFVIKNLDQNLYHRPAAALFMSFFLFPKFVDIFFSAFIFKFFLVSLSGLSFIYFVKSYIKKKIFSEIILFLFFCFSFWTLYIFEIDALSQLFFLCYFIFLIKFFTELYSGNNINKKKIIVFLVNISAAFLIYPQQFLILLLIIGIFFFLSTFKNIFFFFQKNYKIILVSLIVFFIFTIPHYKATYGDFYKTYKMTIMHVDWWGYYGAYILGRENLVTNREFVETIKEIIRDKENLLTILNIIINHNFDNEFYFIFFNIPASLLGFYFLTPGAGINLLNICLFFICLYLIYYALRNIFNSIKVIFTSNIQKIKFLYISIFLSFLLVFLINLINLRIWQLFKLYSFFSFFWILLIFFNLHYKNKKIIFRINYLIVFVLILFPFYKYSVFNNGIGRYDSFPSIIKLDIKKSINWNISEKNIYLCNNVFINENNMDEINIRYVFTKLINWDVNFNTLKKNTILNKKDCMIKLDKGSFIILKY
jgi:hypothetical protein